MICPKCGARLGCTMTKPIEFGTSRRYKCTSCNVNYMTEETFVDRKHSKEKTDTRRKIDDILDTFGEDVDPLYDE